MCGNASTLSGKEGKGHFKPGFSSTAHILLVLGVRGNTHIVMGLLAVSSGHDAELALCGIGVFLEAVPRLRRLAVTELYTEMTENHVKSKLNIPQLKFPLSGSKKKKKPVTTPTSSDMEEVVIERYITLTE